MTTSIFRIFGLGLFLTTIACAHYPGGDDGSGDDGGPPDGGACTGSCPTDGGDPPICDGDEDCGGCGESCTGGVCVKTACCDNGDCPSGEFCAPSTGTCGPPQTCESACSCGSTCDGGTCMPGCAVDGDCCGEDVCDGGTCVPPPPDGCTTDDDCPDGKVCHDGTCVCGGGDDGGGGSDGGMSCPDGKAQLCHYPPGHPARHHEICVGAPAVPAHLAHGDTLGACP